MRQRMIRLFPRWAGVNIMPTISSAGGGPGTVSDFAGKMMRQVVVWGPAAFWVAVLFFLSEWESPGIELIAVYDSVVHFSLYTVLGFTLAWARLRGPRYHHGAFVLLGISLGVMDEFHQSFVPGRTPSIVDVFADTAGVIVGYALFVMIFARWLDSRAVAPR
jgi:VanZ family protein